MSNILFIGGAGFIGSSLVKKFLTDIKYKVFVLEPERSNKERLKPFEQHITLIEGDLRNSALVFEILKNKRINIVVHLVSTLIPGSTMPHFQNEMSDIIIPSMNLMQICAKCNIKLVYFSSGGTIYGNSNNGCHTEEDKKEPISYYGLSKCITEDMIRFESRVSNLDYLILRPSNPYGYGQDIYGKQGLIAVSIGKVLNNEPLKVWGDGESIRDYIYIDDLVNMVYLLIGKKIRNKTFNIGTGVGHSVNEVIKIIDDCICDKIVKVEYLPSRGVDVDALILDISKINKYIDYKPIDLESGIRTFVNMIFNKMN